MPSGSIGVVLTGGTIGAHTHGSALSVGARATQAEAALASGAWPWPGEPRIELVSPLRTLSENMRPRDWLTIAAAARDLIESRGVNGVVVLHGTDTMAYTAAALSFLLCDLDAPIVLSGARLPAGQAESDAQTNVRGALVAARGLGGGAYVAFGAGPGLPVDVHLGTRVRKRRDRAGTFVSVNRDLVAVIDGHDRCEPRQPHARDAVGEYREALDERVLGLRLHPGLDLEAISQAVLAGGVRAVVVELYASATGPDTDDRFSLTRFIERCAAERVVVATAVAEAVEEDGDRYETTVAIDAAGGVFVHGMLPETAIVKMMWALAQASEPAAVGELMLTPIAGELPFSH